MPTLSPMPLTQERIIGSLDRVQDIISLSSASQAVHAAVAQLEWTGIQLLRL